MRALLLTLITEVAWRLRRRTAARLHAFARAELASAIDLRLAAAHTTSDDRRAQYLRHALDEARHADLFARRADELRAELGLPPLGPPTADTEALFERLGERRFLAFVHRGEASATAQLEVIAAHLARCSERGGEAARSLRRTLDVVRAILPDERRHAELTMGRLREVAGSERAARRALGWAARWAVARWVRRRGAATGALVFAAGALVLYVLSAPLAPLLWLTRPARPGWRPP